jgi:multisubunit Na+/H+ antiporter MnhB subunit
VVLGAGFGLLGLAFIAYGHRRQREIRNAISAGSFEHSEDRVLAGLAAAGVGLGALLLILVVIQT